jgi:hypothetical protein
MFYSVSYHYHNGDYTFQHHSNISLQDKSSNSVSFISTILVYKQAVRVVTSVP